MSNTKITNLFKDLNIFPKLEYFIKRGRVKTGTIKSPPVVNHSYKRSTAPTALPISKIITTKLFPLSINESWKDYLKRKDLENAQENLLNLLKCKNGNNSTHENNNNKTNYNDFRISKILKIKIDSEGNYINEFMIMPRNADYSNLNHFVLIHGYGAGLGFFLKNFDEISLNSNWCIHSIDLLGYGCSSRPKFKNSIKPDKTIEEYFIDTLEKWRINRGIEKMLMCSHSLGAYMSILYTIKFPNHVKKLLLISPAGIFSPKNLKLNIPKWFNYLWEQNISPFSIIRNTGPFGSLITSGWTSRRFSKLSLKEQFFLHKYTYSIFNAPGSGEYYMNSILGAGGIPKLPMIEKIDQINCDTIWCYGDEDWMPKEGGWESIKKIKGKYNGKFTAEFKEFKNSGHHIYLDNYKDFNKFILDEMENYEKKYVNN